MRIVPCLTDVSHFDVVFLSPGPGSGTDGIVPALKAKLAHAVLIQTGSVLVVGVVKPVRGLIRAETIETQLVTIAVL